eukprot:10251068-Alexandrium_andersonii.AAC.1
MYKQVQGTTCEGMNTHAGCNRVHGPRSEYLHMARHLHTCNALARQAHAEQVRTPCTHERNKQARQGGRIGIEHKGRLTEQDTCAAKLWQHDTA